MQRNDRRIASAFVVGVALALVTAAAERVSAQVNSQCNSLSGVPQTLCVAYCDVGHCNTSANPSCDGLRAALEQQTGHRAFPCDCGDGVVQSGEACDPPGSQCPN